MTNKVTMIRLLLLTVLTVISTKSAVAQDVTQVAVNEYAIPTGSLLGAVKVDFTINMNSGSIASDTTTEGLEPTTTTGSGSGAVFTLAEKASDNSVDSVTVTCGGSGYKAGDTITFPSAKLASNADIVFTIGSGAILTADVFGVLKSGDILARITTNSGGAETVAEIFKGVTNTRTGTGAIIGIIGEGGSATSGATEARVTTCGSGYKPGDVITIAATDLVGSTAIAITLTAGDIEGYVKSTPTTGYRTSEGAVLSFAGNTLAGYYVALKKTTTHVQVVPTFSTAGALTASLGATTDTSLLTTVPSSTFFPTGDGLNILKLVSSADGTYELNFMKPDDEVKHLVGASSKRSIAIAYNPAAIGEFTCSAFKDSTTGAAIPENRDEVTASSTDTNIIAKSVRTHNIVPEDMFSSFQMSLNGLEPDTAYHIYCFHLSHGIISNTAATVKTDKASLTGVKVLPTGDDRAGAYTSLTLTFTHEKPLAPGATIAFKLYNDYDTAQTLTADGTCGAQIATITSGGQTITGSHTCAAASNELTVTLVTGGSTVASGTRGTEIIIVLTDNDPGLNLADNAAAGTLVTFDLEVSGHGKLQQQNGWTTA